MLFWTQDQRDAAFRTMETVPKVVVNTVPAGGAVYPLPQGKPIDIGLDVDAYMGKQRNAGLIIVQDGKIRLEKYALGYDASGRWTSFSVAKSFTSTLVGAAVKDGYIKSLDDKVTAYIPGLKGSAYDDVSVKQLLTMTSGVKWNEDYTDPKSDVAQFNLQKPVPGEDITVSYMKTLPREAPAGSKWVYKTGETNLIGVLVSSATGKTLAAYLSEKVWKPFGMERDAVWMLGPTGHEISGCCVSASLKDYARFGQFILNGGVAGGQKVLPDDWLRAATTKQASIDLPGRGYGYQWWTNDDGSFAAQGIFGQGIFIDPKRKLVIASNGNWPTATDPEGVGAAREAFYKSVQTAVDKEAK
ncbi:CubicO group peptidase (beta-lactamase class C family) [Sphingopyxis panaciterrae]|uniref:serine hydrolase domain-containing protein n=1 Tax=Sphingopyxis panaciterrae TaxID=363841 RepID=UPI003132BFA4|nr:CubicO group peptidase (beta-lactamase class C family) [Sphingopyxis panaciterrae]